MPVTRLCFKLAQDNNYIDLAQSLSLIQRTLIRQKQKFTVLGGQIVDDGDPTVSVSTLPNFWYTRAAINRCFRAWKSTRAKALANADLTSVDQGVGKYSDFKITMNGATVSNNLLPQFTDSSATSDLPTSGTEWATASIVNEAGQEKHFMVLGDHTTNFYSAMMGWLATRASPNSHIEPDMPDLHDAAGNAGADGIDDYQQDFINLLHETTDGQQERLELLYEDNNNGPFDPANLYGNIGDPFNMQLQSKSYVKGTLGQASAMIPGFEALCGLIHVRCNGGSSPLLFLDVMNTPERF